MFSFFPRLDFPSSPEDSFNTSTSTDSEISLESQIALRELEFTLDTEEYRQEIYQYISSHQFKTMPRIGFMDHQPDVTFGMRSILVDWLVEVAEEYKIHSETVFLTVNYVDRFLSQMSVVRNKLQLVGAACMFIAA